MRLFFLIAWLGAFILPHTTSGQTPATPLAPATQSPYRLRVPVNEIALTFHASDAHGKPLTRLTERDIELSDNGKSQDHILILQPLQDLSIRSGFLFDISASMLKDLNFNRAIVQMYASSLLRKGVDQAFVMQFDTHTQLTRGWTGDDSAIAKGSAAIGPRSNRIDPLTAIFDSLYTTCRDQWNGKESDSTGNFILLFSDGEDNASHVYLSEAVDMCQRRHIAIYVIEAKPSSHFSDGPKNLADLATQTGGRVFRHPKAKDIPDDLQRIEAEQRNQFRLVYRPAAFVADGSFHPIQLRCLTQGCRIATRSGYYAFPRP